MRSIVLANEGAARDAMLGATEAEGWPPPRCVSAWDAFMREFAAARPGCALVDFETLERAGASTLRAAALTLRALGLPTVAVVEDAALERFLPFVGEYPFWLPRSSLDRLADVAAAAGAQHERPAASKDDAAGGSPTATPSAVAAAATTGIASHPTPRTQDVAASRVAPIAVAGAPVIAVSDASAFFGAGAATGSARPSFETVQAPAVSESAARAFEDAPISGMLDAVFGGGWGDDPPHEPTPRGTPVVPYDAVPEPSPGTVSGASRRVGQRGDASLELSDSAVLSRVPPEVRSLSGTVARLVDDPSPSATSTPDDLAASGAVDRWPSRGAEPVGGSVTSDSGSGTATRGGGASTEKTVSGTFAYAASGPSPRVDVESPAEAPRPDLADDAALHSGRNEAMLELEMGGDPSSGAAPTPPAPNLVARLELTDPNEGGVVLGRVAEVLLALWALRATGELVLNNGTLERRVVLLEGEPGLVFTAPSADDDRRVLSTFGWTSGSYRFERKAVPEAQFFTLGEPLEFIYRGFERHVSMNDSASVVAPHMKRYVVLTDHAPRFARVMGLERFAAFLDGLRGDTTLESVMGRRDADVTETLRHVHFGAMAGALVFVGQPASRVSLDLIVAELSPPTGSGVAERAVVGAGGSGGSSGGSRSARAPRFTPAPAAIPAATAEGDASPGAQPSARETFERLSRAWDRFSAADGYALFGLAAGCGPDEVSRRFYELVREYHPDRFAQSTTPETRQLAERLFVHIRSAHSDLVARERAAAAGGAGAADPASANTLTDSGVQRRRMRAGAARLASSGAQPSVRAAGSAPEQASGSRTVADALERMRSKPAAPAPEPIAAFTNPTTAVRRQSGEQLMRNVRSSTEQGNFAKAAEMLEFAVQRGLNGPMVDAYRIFLAYANRESRAADAIDGLEKVAPSMGDDVDRSWLFCLVGHVCRLEELNKQAIDAYDRAVKLWRDNESASRWARHLRKRVQDDEKKSPFSASFLNKLFTQKPK